MNARIASSAVFAVSVLAMAAPSALASVTLTPPSADFGSLNVGTTSPPQSFTLTNTCDAESGGQPGNCISPNAVNSDVSTTGDFAQTTNCPTILLTLHYPASTSCTINVTFTPGTPGARAGTLNAGGMSRPLSGTGVALPVQPTGQRA